MNSLALSSGTRSDQMYSANLPYRAKECEGGVELARRQAWSHHLWFPKQREFEKRSLHVSVSFGHSLLDTTRASSSVFVAHSRELKIRRRRQQKRQERCRHDTQTKQTISASAAHVFAYFFDVTTKLRRDNWTCQDMVLRNSSPETFPYIWQSTWVGIYRIWRLNEREFTL